MNDQCKNFSFCGSSSHGEDLCKSCEVNEHPKRFQGCMFCRRPQKDSHCCLICTADFCSWVKESTNIDDGYLAGLKLLNSEWKMIKLPFIQRDVRFYNEWFGFYIGDDKWKIPDVKMETNAIVMSEYNHVVLEILLNNNDIDIYAEVQLTS
uniref:Uncharacterized protein n=1 Tax=Pithovirus LCPAC401 TaxID=2506595 RepID=A0A481ZCL1_9VIRU|nr:MAG: hypothetical protein LCPAC401_04370 [Pithovirus LCPAC401]